MESSPIWNALNATMPGPARAWALCWYYSGDTCSVNSFKVTRVYLDLATAQRDFDFVKGVPGSSVEFVLVEAELIEA